MVDEVLEELRSVLARLMNLDLWPPWDAVRTVVDAVGDAITIASTPPAPAPDDLDAAAVEWRGIALAVDRAHSDLAELRQEVPRTVWEGTAGTSFRASVTNFNARVETVPVAARGVRSALDTLSGAMAAARARHEDGHTVLSRNLTVDLGIGTPWGLAEKLARILGDIIEGVRELIGAYEDARDALAVARQEIQTAVDAITLPDHLPPDSVGAIDVVNAWDDDGPLGGSVLPRYEEAFGDLSAGDRAAVEQALDTARSPEEAAWVMAAVASGLSGAALARYLQQLRRTDPDDLDPRNHPASTFTQPNQQTCGSSSLVMSRMLNDPAYAMWVMTGYDPATGETTGGDATSRFNDEALAMHDRTNQWTDRNGGWQMDWPQAIGTQPYALANEMSAQGGSGVPGTDYDVRWVDPKDATSTFNAIVAANENGHTVPMYVGDDLYPGHITLVTSTTGDTITYYDPAGVERTVTRDDFVNGNLPTSQENPWAVVLPTG
ncbi:WXG100 family type VII secretion target [Nocardioides sp.]|uniref:WXG100 family type VII secretion target n=1 Tax=Nocardioides sp. TaxID=35761 RepID=UPI0027358053|nr:hypothetical protein [Nocardioides sp.]MDP3893058.1 hypothetical protein [Nocardioides sp.]